MKNTIITLALAIALFTSCTVSESTADAYNTLVDVAGVYMSEEDAAKLNTADSIIGIVFEAAAAAEEVTTQTEGEAQ